MSLNFQAHEFLPAGGAVDGSACVSKELFSDILASARRVGNPMRQALEIARIRQLIASCAWTDAALALLALDQPRWKLRRLAYDGGEWHCALSKNREMPEWLDADVETHHADMALAILGALRQARNEEAACTLPGTAMGLNATDASWTPVLCDNFA